MCVLWALTIQILHVKDNLFWGYFNTLGAGGGGVFSMATRELNSTVLKFRLI